MYIYIAGPEPAIYRWPLMMFNLKKHCCTVLMTSIEKCQFESPLWHSCLFMEICLIFYSYYIVTRGYIYIYIYTMKAMYVMYIYYSFIRLYYKFTYLKTSRPPQRLEPASFCSTGRCAIRYTNRPGSTLWYFWLYSNIFINFD